LFSKFSRTLRSQFQFSRCPLICLGLLMASLSFSPSFLSHFYFSLISLSLFLPHFSLSLSLAHMLPNCIFFACDQRNDSLLLSPLLSLSLFLPHFLLIFFLSLSLSLSYSVSVFSRLTFSL